MESVLGRYRNLIVLTAVLFAQVLGLAVQVKRTTDTESTRLIRLWAVSAVTPFEKALVWTQASTRNLWRNYFYLRGVRSENRELKQQIQEMRLEQVRLAQDADQARRLQALLSFKEQFISKTMAAQVIGLSGSEQSRAVYIDKGENDGIKPDMAVINADGIVGKVLHVYPSTSLVLLLNDQTSGVGAILEKSRLQGILRGTPSGEVVLEKVMGDETVAPGERVLTSGGDRIFPKGLPIGTVTRVSPGQDLFLNIRVRPSANLSKLEEVLVVTKIDERQAAPELAGPMRAADILAERLPTVPPKPETPAGTAAQPGVTPAPGASAAPPANKPASTAASHPAAPLGTGAGTGSAARTAASGAKPANSTPAALGDGIPDTKSKPVIPGANAAGPAKPKSAPSAVPGMPNSTVSTTPSAAGTAGPPRPNGSAGTPAVSQGAAKPEVPVKPQTPPQDNPQ